MSAFLILTVLCLFHRRKRTNRTNANDATVPALMPARVLGGRLEVLVFCAVLGGVTEADDVAEVPRTDTEGWKPEVMITRSEVVALELDGVIVGSDGVLLTTTDTGGT